ncbi:MAG: ester cyclase [Thermomicrobiales bacterium]
MTATSLARTELEAIARRWVEAGWRRGDATAVRAMYAEDFVDLSHPSGQPGNRDDNVAGIVELYQAFPDFMTVVNDLVIDETAGTVAVRWSATGTHRGPFMGVVPTGRPVRFTGIETLRVVNGLIVERAGEWNGLEILDQIGVQWS